MTSPEDLTGQERAALALWLLIQSPMSTRQIAERCGITKSGAWQMLCKLARVVPLSYEGGEWFVNNSRVLYGGRV